MTKRQAAILTKVLMAVEQYGLLMQADGKLPSVVTLTVGKPVRGSWWGHPKGDTIHIINNELKEHPDIITTYLVSRKITYVHRRVWSALFGVAMSGEPWQKKDIGLHARRIFKCVTQRDYVRSDDKSIFGKMSTVERRTGIIELERRLLVHSIDTHTESGTHATTLQTWERCRVQKRFRGQPLAIDKAYRRIERMIEDWHIGPNVRSLRPWNTE